jgi:hypothetical protein
VDGKNKTVTVCYRSGKMGGPHDRLLTAVTSFHPRNATSASWEGSAGQKSCQFVSNHPLECSAKNMVKCGDFLFRKCKVMVYG